MIKGDVRMDELIKELNNDLKVLNTDRVGDEYEIHIEYVPEHMTYCPSCGQAATRQHSWKIRRIGDLPVYNHKVSLMIHRRQFFCDNKDCSRKIVTEKFDFVSSTGRRTKRLDEHLLDMAKTMSAIGEERVVRKNVANVSNDTILRRVKKNSTNKT